MGSDAPSNASAPSVPVMTFSAVEPRLDAIVMLRRDSASSRSGSATTTNSSPRPVANPRFTPGPPNATGANSAPLTPIPSSLLQPVDEEPNTPSSTVVEFGDLTRGTVPSAAELVESIHRSYSQVEGGRTESRSSSKPRGARDGHEGRDTARDQSRSRALPTSAVPRERSQSTNRTPTAKDSRGTDSEKGLADERINRFLQSMAQQAAQTAESELLQENRSLYQRIAALQRTERELLAENQDLTRKFAALKQHHDRRARQWGEGLRRKETEYEARIQELSEQLLDLASTHPLKLPAVLSNEDISAWFDDQDLSWNTWACTFGHHDPMRLSSGLHPLQLQELCDEVKDFVRMTDSGALPDELLSGGKAAIHTLLNGMLANFICAEILASPMWVFFATSLGTLESPGIVPAKPLPGLPSVGFRMDMNSFSDVAPLRPGPCPTPKSPQFPPPLITSMMPPLGASLSQLGLPAKADMERLVHMLTDAQEESSRVAAHHWRAQMMRLFADGGFSLKDVAAAGRNDSRRTFVESRLNFARKLKERFLGGAARYLLQDQDATGIEKLERTLTEIMDDALRFSCRLWSRVAPLRLHTWKDLAKKEFLGSNQLVTLCHAQAAVGSCKHGHEGCNNKRAGSPRGEDRGRSIVMIVQPAVVTDNVNLQGNDNGSVANVNANANANANATANANGGGKGADSVVLVWLRARVMVSGPMRCEGESLESTPPGTGSDSVPDKSSSNIAAAAKPATPKDLDDVLPASSYKGSTSRPEQH